MTELLKVRRQIKSKKPKFQRQDANRLHLQQKWTRPRGMHSKMRLKIKGHKKRPSTGYGSPKKVKYTLRSGLLPQLIHNKNLLETIDSKTKAPIISSGVGDKKRLEILEYALLKNIQIANIKDTKKALEAIKQKIQDRKKQTASSQEQKKASRQESLKKAQQKQEQQVPPEEQKTKDQEEQKQILEKEHSHEHTPKIEQRKQSDKIAKKDQVRTKVPEGGDRGVQHK